MHWKIKASIQKTLSLSKVGDRINHLHALWQKNYHKKKFAFQFHECLRKYDYCIFTNKNRATALELGTGYSMIQPIVLSLIGFEKIITVDITRDVTFNSLKKELIYFRSQDVINKLVSKSIYSKNEIESKIATIINCKSIEDILQILNIIYVAPYELSNSIFKNTTFDYIFSQTVFEHIRPEILENLFEFFLKNLKKGGYCVHTINFVDHFTNPGFFQDKKISEYNFLKYSDKYWEFWAGNEIAYVNRLSYPFYINLCKTYQFELIDFIGENYKKSKYFDVNTVHPDVLKKYSTTPSKEDLVRYQRGTIIFKK